MYKIGFEKSSGSHYVYSGQRNKDVIFFGSKIACRALIMILSMRDIDMPIKVIKAWIALNEKTMEHMDDNQLEEHINIIGYLQMCRMRMRDNAIKLLDRKENE